MSTLVVYCHPDPASFTAAPRDRVVAALRRARRRRPGPDLYADGFDPCSPPTSGAATSSPEPTRPSPTTPPTCSGASNSCSSTRRGGAVSRRCSRAGSTGCWSATWRGTCRPGSNRLHGRLRNVRRIVAVTTHGSSKVVNAVEGEVGKRLVTPHAALAVPPAGPHRRGSPSTASTPPPPSSDGVPRPGRSGAAMTASAVLPPAARSWPRSASMIDPPTTGAAGAHRARLRAAADVSRAAGPERRRDHRADDATAVVGARRPACGHPPPGRGDAAQRRPAVRRRPVELADPPRSTATTSGRCSTGRPARSGTSWCSPRRWAPRSCSATRTGRCGCRAVRRAAVGRACRGTTSRPCRPGSTQVAAMRRAAGDRDVLRDAARVRRPRPRRAGDRRAARLPPGRPTARRVRSSACRQPPPLDVQRAGRPRPAAPRAGPDRRRRRLRRRRRAAPARRAPRPEPAAESEVDGLRGMRHTSGRRYSFDDPTATVIVVSEDGPVTVLRGGDVIGTSPARGVPITPDVTP